MFQVVANIPQNPAHFPPTPPATPTPHGATSVPTITSIPQGATIGSPTPQGAMALSAAGSPVPQGSPIVTLSVAEIGELTGNAPNLPEEQLPWLLNIVLATTTHCL